MKILVCIDNSRHGKKVVEKASKIVKRVQNAEPTIMYVYNTEGSMIPSHSINKFYLEKEEIEHKVLGEAQKQFEKEGIENIETRLEKGHPATTITQVVNEEDFDMVILGNRGHRGLKKFFLGSVSNAVAQEIDRDILIIK